MKLKYGLLLAKRGHRRRSRRPLAVLLLHRLEDFLENSEFTGDLENPFLLKPELFFRLPEQNAEQIVCKVLRGDYEPLHLAGLLHALHRQAALRDRCVGSVGAPAGRRGGVRSLGEGQGFLQELVDALAAAASFGGGIGSAVVDVGGAVGGRKLLPLLEELPEPDNVSDLVRAAGGGGRQQQLL